MKWILASEQSPTKELGIEIIGRSKNGRVDNYSWDNFTKFHRPSHHEADELYEWLDESESTAPVEGEWVRVEDGLPDEGDRVLCLAFSGFMSVGFYYKGVWERNDRANTFAEHGYTVTHWMPLPSPPNKSNGG